jgi:GNAT superfamily N-acetyltransferase
VSVATSQLAARVEPVGVAAVTAAAGDLVAVFRAAFSQPPYDETPAHAERFRRRLAAAGSGRTATWLHRQFELVELAVQPEHQGRGLGTVLHDALLEGLEHRGAWLLAHPEARPARAFCCRRGWAEVASCAHGGRRRLVLARPLKGLGGPVA